MQRLAEYIWLDGAKPTQQLRSKSRVVELPQDRNVDPNDLPEWGFDGSSTYQAKGDDSDLTLIPVRVLLDPIRKGGNVLVLCEVMNPDGTAHSTNTRAELRKVLDEGASEQEPWFGFEQEYTLFKNRSPLGWPKDGFPAPQGPYYCGVGTNNVYGRKFVEAHTFACLEAGIMLYGINAEVMPGQWEFQVGHRGFKDEAGDPLTVADHMWMARYLLNRIGEEYDITVSLDPKPMKGDWNGAGNHTNFSTRDMRDPVTGIATIDAAVERLSTTHEAHIAQYGANLAERLTGQHETCSITEFKAGVANRNASIRIPRHVSTLGGGYLEDRRPGANSDPYVVSTSILRTVLAMQSA